MDRFAGRQNIIIGFFCVCALLLIYKSAELQIFESKYSEQARRTTLDKRINYPSRGLIYDRNDNLLVANTPIYDIKATYNKVDPKMDTAVFCELLEIPVDTFSVLLDKNWKSRRYHKSVPFRFLSKVRPEVFAKFQERMFEFPGFYPVTRNIRTYPHENAAHTLGYLGEVDQRTIDRSEGKYEAGDFLGVSGIEKSYDTMISAPTYDPNILKMDINRGTAFNDLLSDTINKPMLDRSVLSKYPPGSIFKPIFALVAMQMGITEANRVNGWKWSYILSLGIGQGELELTTLQMANLATIIANRGHYYKPHLLRAIYGDKQSIPAEYLQRRNTRIDPQHYEPVIEGMEKVISQGTAKAAYVPGLAICGKTGTSQNQRKVSHSVFFGFAPKDNPKIAIAVYVENAGSGGAIAAPIAGLMMEKYLKGEVATNRIWLEEAMVTRNLLDPYEGRSVINSATLEGE